MIEKGTSYFAAQRCGPSTTGYHAPCHLDDAVRADNGQFIDLVGGWHDANDLLKGTRNTVIALTGLLRVAENSQDRKLKARILDEAKWGNSYFFKMQDAEGYMYSSGVHNLAAGPGRGANNHWTDNIRGTADDRKTTMQVGPPHLQHMFIAAQTHLATLYQGWDAPYTKICFDAALRCFNWVHTRESQTNLDFGTGAEAGARLYLATNDRKYLDYALKMAEGFAALQETGSSSETLKGYFYQDASRSRTVLYHGIEPLGPIGFCEMIEALKAKMDVSRWERVLSMHCDEYLMPMAGLNAFGIVPSAVKLEEPHPGSRRYRGTSYVYFEFPRGGGNYQGNTSNMAGTGIVLCYARRILGSEKYQYQAQRMLDWILGLNPFDLCMMIGIGLKNPPMWLAPEFLPFPDVTDIPGAVVNGIAGDDAEPARYAGGYLADMRGMDSARGADHLASERVVLRKQRVIQEMRVRGAPDLAAVVSGDGGSFVTEIDACRTEQVPACRRMPAVSCSASDDSDVRHEQHRAAMGTQFSIVAYGGGDVPTEAALSAAFEEICRVDRKWSAYRLDSDISALNRLAASQAVRIDSELFRMLETCLHYSQETDGAFDITVGPLVTTWGFFKGSGRLPDPQEISLALTRVGWRKIVLDRSRHTVSFAVPGMRLDLGAIGKGYAIDRAAAALRRAGVRSALLTAGGSSIVAFGSPPQKKGWTVLIRDPKDSKKTAAALLLKNASVSTSGAHEKCFRANNRTYSHIIDPRTGYPAQGVLSCSVVARTGTQTEACSTAFFVLGKNAAISCLKIHPGIRVLMCCDAGCEWLQ